MHWSFSTHSLDATLLWKQKFVHFNSHSSRNKIFQIVKIGWLVEDKKRCEKFDQIQQWRMSCGVVHGCNDSTFIRMIFTSLFHAMFLYVNAWVTLHWKKNINCIDTVLASRESYTIYTWLNQLYADWNESYGVLLLLLLFILQMNNECDNNDIYPTLISVIVFSC